MIEWPAEEKLEGAAKSNLDRFRKTAAARELDEDPGTWAVHSFARQAEPPVRIILVNEQGDEITWTLGGDGAWTIRRKDRL